MGKNINRVLKEEDVGSIGIGAMIVFIAMVLVAGIAASVLIQTSTSLESQAMTTGRETTKEVSTGISVVNIEGYNVSGVIVRMAVVVRPRAGSSDVDLAETVIQISDSITTNFLTYDDNTYTGAIDINGNLFNENFFTETSTNFSIIVIEDADGSCGSASSAVINSGDYVILGINTTLCFAPGLSPRADIWGTVVPEIGSPGVISFKCPASFIDACVELQ
jgi:flagellin FlaB